MKTDGSMNVHHNEDKKIRIPFSDEEITDKMNRRFKGFMQAIDNKTD